MPGEAHIPSYSNFTGKDVFMDYLLFLFGPKNIQ
jgi:hypothetical protein